MATKKIKNLPDADRMFLADVEKRIADLRKQKQCRPTGKEEAVIAAGSRKKEDAPGLGFWPRLQ